MACGCRGSSERSYRTPARTQVAHAVAAAASAGSMAQFEVVKADGAPTGRKFTSLVAAARYATAIGGKTKPVK